MAAARCAHCGLPREMVMPKPTKMSLTPGAAHALVQRAREQLDRARRHAPDSDPNGKAQHAYRLAAESARLAARTAGAAVLVCLDRAEGRAQWPIGKMLREAGRGISRPDLTDLSVRIEGIAAIAHGNCFYGGQSDACDPGEIESMVQAAETVVKSAREACRVTPQPGRRR